MNTIKSIITAIALILTVCTSVEASATTLNYSRIVQCAVYAAKANMPKEVQDGFAQIVSEFVANNHITEQSVTYEVGYANGVLDMRRFQGDNPITKEQAALILYPILCTDEAMGIIQ